MNLSGVLFGLQCFQVLFLGLHDWIPLGALNDLKAMRKENPRHKLILGTLTSTLPFAIGVAGSAAHFAKAYPSWLLWWLWISYGLLFVGELRAWWIPYFFGAKRTLVERYQALFGATHAILAERNGIRPNTLHIVLHAATLETLVVLGVFAANRA